eukprot:7357018-Prymnesium_polylepis.1
MRTSARPPSSRRRAEPVFHCMLQRAYPFSNPPSLICDSRLPMRGTDQLKRLQAAGARLQRRP